MRSTTVILSDTHLGPRFKQKKLDHLIQLVDVADEVIINGDFWDGFFWSFDDFLHSRWQPLLQALARKKTIYITGNHDPIEMIDDRAYSFCQWYGEEYVAQMPDGSMAHITHGHQIELPLDARIPILNRRYLKQAGSTLDKAYKKVMARRWLRTSNPVNQPFKTWRLNQVAPEYWLICGHTHYPEHDPTLKFLNTGYSIGGYSSYLIADPDNIRLVRDSY